MRVEKKGGKGEGKKKAEAGMEWAERGREVSQKDATCSPGSRLLLK